MEADRTVERRLTELAERAAKTGVAQHTGFLTPAAMAQAEICAQKAGIPLFAFGGVEGAERQVVFFSDDEPEEWPFICLLLKWNAKFGAIEHPDLLGATLALGFDRGKIGDIYIESEQAFLFVLADIASYLEVSLARVGNVPVRVSQTESLPQLSQKEGVTVRGTVSSLRLDSLLGLAFRASRGKVQGWVSEGRVQVDFRPELRPDRQLQEGATLSVRGLGRAVVSEIGGRTKKDRIGVTLLRF